ncbi:MAG: hypothetical protein ABI193_01840 [Minicystis sp.]
MFLNAPEDDELRLALQKHLSPLERDGLLHAWSSEAVSPGSDGAEEARFALENARIIVVFVSADLLASDQLTASVERALDRHLRGEALLLAVEARSVDWAQTPFHRLTPLGKRTPAINDVALSTTKDRDQGLVKIAARIREAVLPPSPNPLSAHRCPAPMR